MQQIDCLGWAAGLVFSIYGLRIGVRTNNPEILDRVMRLLPPSSRPSSRQKVDLLYSLVAGENEPGSRNREHHLLYQNTTRLLYTPDLDSVMEALEGTMRVAIASAARRRVFVHAGSVALHGRAIVLPGESGAGKSTLVDALIRAGAVYLSDEYAVFDQQGRVSPFPSPLRLFPATPGARRKIAYDLGGRSVHSRPLPLGLVVVTKYQPEIRSWRPRRLTEGRALLALTVGASAVRSRPQMVIPTLTRAVKGVPAYSGARSDADAAAERIVEMMDTLYRSNSRVPS